MLLLALTWQQYSSLQVSLHQQAGAPDFPDLMKMWLLCLHVVVAHAVASNHERSHPISPG